MMIIPFLCSFVGGEMMDMELQSGNVAKAVLLILLFASILSWSIILSKWSSLRRARTQSGRFVRAFRKAARLQDLVAVSDQFKPSPLVPVFEGGLQELRRQGGSFNITGIQRAAQIASSEELTRLERKLPWLATTGAVAPFIGLFGTVWGIIDAFQGLGNAGAATLRAVPPGISEALITTAAGLAAAIPAVIGYNYCLGQLRRLNSAMDEFTLRFTAIVEQHAEGAPGPGALEACERRLSPCGSLLQRPRASD